MQAKISRKEFKAQARRQHQILVERQVPVKLADVQESLAVSLGYRNLAHMYGVIQTAVDSEVPLTRVKNWTRWVMYLATEDDAGKHNFGEEFWCLLPEGSTLDDLASRDRAKARRLLEAAQPFAEGFVLSAETTVLETYVELPSIEKYGLTPPSNEEKVNAWVVEKLGFRVPKRGVEVSRKDRRDDGGELVALSIAVTDQDAAFIREKLFPADATPQVSLFDVTFDTASYTDDRDLLDELLSAEFIARFNEIARAEGRFPKGVVELVEGHNSEDDEQEDSDIHCFVTVTLRVQAASEEEAEEFEPPEVLLQEVFEELLPGHDAEYWEVLEVSEVKG